MNRWIMSLCLIGCYSLAGAQSQPKFSIVSLTSPKLTLSANSTAEVQYFVTNNTKITRTLTMEPISGVSSINTDGYCGNPFTLGYRQTCILALQINGGMLANMKKYRVVGGPKICKTMSSSNIAPDPLLCSQPSIDDSLDIVILTTEVATLSITGSPVSLFLNGTSQTLIVNNLSTNVVATGITSSLDGDLVGAVSQNGNCSILNPGENCQFIYTPGTTAVPLTNFTISGENTNVVTAAMSVQIVLSNCFYDSGLEVLICTSSSGGLTQLGGDIYRHYSGSSCPFDGGIYNIPATTLLTNTTYMTSPIDASVVGCNVSLCNNRDCSDLETTSTVIHS